MGIDTTKLVKAHIKLRDARSAAKKKFDAEDDILKASQEKLEAMMLKFMIDNNSDSVRTEHGTFYRQEDVIPRGEDWDAFYKWVAKNDAFDFLERRIKKTAVAEYMEANKGKIPPGVSVLREFVVRVRRS